MERDILEAEEALLRMDENALVEEEIYEKYANRGSYKQPSHYSSLKPDDIPEDGDDVDESHQDSKEEGRHEGGQKRYTEGKALYDEKEIGGGNWEASGGDLEDPLERPVCDPRTRSQEELGQDPDQEQEGEREREDAEIEQRGHLNDGPATRCVLTIPL